MTAAIRAELTGQDTAVALGIAANSHTPILSLCRALVDGGHDPAAPLEAYRGDVLCLRVRSIGEAAGLRIGSHGVGFEAAPECDAAPPMRLKKWAVW
jgi:hypothetical protein